MMADRIELCDGIIAYIDEENVYSCRYPWLGREIDVKLCSDKEDNNSQIEAIKKAFEEFVANKDNYLKLCQSDIVDKFIPYIAENNTASCLNISEDDFYADYSLSEVFIVISEFGDEMQITFSSENDEDMLAVHRDLENGNIIEFFDGLNAIFADDMGL